MEPRALLNLEVIPKSKIIDVSRPIDGILVGTNAHANGKVRIHADDPNGFVKDNTETGLVYQPDARPNDANYTAPEPLKQPKSDNNTVGSTVRAEIRLHRLLTSMNIDLTSRGLGSELLTDSYFFYDSRNIHEGCDICFKTENVRIAYYFNETYAKFEKGQAVTNIVDVNFCQIFVPTTLKPYPKPTNGYGEIIRDDPFYCAHHKPDCSPIPFAG